MSESDRSGEMNSVADFFEPEVAEDSGNAFKIETPTEEIEAEKTAEDLEAFFERTDREKAERQRVYSVYSTDTPQTDYDDYQEGKILTVEGRFKKVKNVFSGSEHLKAWGLIAALILVVFLLLNSSIFNLKYYEIHGNERVADQTILVDLGLKEGTNLFRYAISHLHANPVVDPRLSTVDVYFDWPNKVRIVVEESTTIGYVYFQGTYLCIDRKGQVANTTSQPDEDLPLIIGLTVGSFNIGECLNTDDVLRYDAVVAVGTAIRKYDLQTIVNEVNVRVLDDIVLQTDKMEIRLGSIADVERKVCVVAGVLDMKGIPEGVIHIEDMTSQIFIEPFDSYVEEGSPQDTIGIDDPSELFKDDEDEDEED